MRRREVIALIGAAAASFRPHAGAAQAPPVVGLLSSRSAEDSRALLSALHGGLAEAGYVDGRNLSIEYRFALGQYEALSPLAAELAGRGVSVIVTVGGDPSAMAAKDSATTVPIVSIFGTDPVERGLVRSLARPGGNVTGFSNLTLSVEPKRLGLLRELIPRARTVGILLNPNRPAANDQLAQFENAARSVGLSVHVLRASSDAEVEGSFASIDQHRLPALAVATDPFFSSRRHKLAELAARHSVPAMYSFREFVEAGGLMSYGVDLAEAYRQVGLYVGRILKGERPADMPVLQPTRFEFLINLRTANVLGLTIPATLLARADEVIE
jgi:putative tryptophan/tyrosine transport system substrate-binding protein